MDTDDDDESRGPANRELFRAYDWREIGVQLAAYASWKAAGFRWRTGLEDALPQGNTPESVAAAAIEKVLSGKRVWDPERADLLWFLKRVVDSLIDHLARSSDNRRQERLPDPESEHQALDRAEYQGSSHDHSGLMPQPPSNPERALVGPDDGTPEARVQSLFVALEGQDDLAAVVRVVLDQGESKPKAIAECLGTTVHDVYNRLKRLRRLATRTRAQAPSPARRAV